MTIISGTADHRFPIFVSIFITVVRNMPKYPHLFPSLDQAIFWNMMLRLPQMAFPGSIFQKFSGVACPRTPLGCLTPSARVCMTTHTTLASPLIGMHVWTTKNEWRPIRDRSKLDHFERWSRWVNFLPIAARSICPRLCPQFPPAY
jgi:hypothetical protein